MDITNEIVLMKKQRQVSKKKQVGFTIDQARFQKIYDTLSPKSPYFELISKSEQFDFMLYLLEKYMDASPAFNNSVN